MNILSINRKLNKSFGDCVKADFVDGCIVLNGTVDTWEQCVEAGMMAATKFSKVHVVNDIICKETKDIQMRIPKLSDSALDGMTPDVLVIGGGISGCSIARELMRYNLKVLLVEKESDLALAASGRNDGEVHPGVDLGKGSLKHKYIRRGNKMYDDICAELGVSFKRVGQYACFANPLLLIPVFFYSLWRKYVDGISDTRIALAKEIHAKEPLLNDKFVFALSNPCSGTISPYELTIAYADNAVQNGAKVALNTVVLDICVENHNIVSVKTNRGTIYPRLVINAAGVWSDEIARMAGDRFFSIHPRRGTNAILDKKCGKTFGTIASIVGVKTTIGATNTKGGGIVHTAHDNLLVGPDAIETWERENVATNSESIDRVFAKQIITMPSLSERDIITYFTGVRAPTYEEDFIIEKGRKTNNIIHVAGIQSPGLTTAPAVAVDVASLAASMLDVKEKNDKFDPIRHVLPPLNTLPDSQRAELIKKNPDYGIIVCRCEEISKGEIIDALNSPVCVPTLDGIKKRVRPGMGRCQGGFCSPLVTKIIAEYLGIPISQVKKSSEDSPIVFEHKAEEEKND